MPSRLSLSIPPPLSHLRLCVHLPVFFWLQPQPRSRLPPRRNSSSQKLLERFHVCPLLSRERMGAACHLPTARPVYRYIFLCPGRAEALVSEKT